MTISKKTDLKLKLVALQIAAQEVIEMKGEIDIDELFVRAREVYHRAHEEQIYDWESPWSKKEEKKEEKPVVKPKPAAKPKKLENGMKECPSCGEAVPEGWKVHQYKKDGQKCGHKFEES